VFVTDYKAPLCGLICLHNKW